MIGDIGPLILIYTGEVCITFHVCDYCYVAIDSGTAFVYICDDVYAVRTCELPSPDTVVRDVTAAGWLNSISASGIELLRASPERELDA
jgi:hypothetical protein